MSSPIHTSSPRLLRTSAPLALAAALLASVAGCVPEAGESEAANERLLEPAEGTVCGAQVWLYPDGTRAESPIVYYYDHINDELERDPALRARVGFDGVLTCADAERFTLLKRAYGDANPIDELAEIPVADGSLAPEVVPRVYLGQSADKPGVVMINNKCSGVFITPRHILSAAHCFSGGGAQSIDILEDGGHEAERDGYVHIHPNYTGGPGGSDVNDDIAVISLWNDLPWTPTPHRFYTGTTNLGTQLQIYGYGYTSNAKQGEGTLRRGKDGAPINLNYHSGGYFRATAHTARNCKGDSGGPAIDESPFMSITWGLAAHHEVGPGEEGNACPSEGRDMRWTKTNVKAGWIAARLLENHDGDFSCTQYTYGTNGSYYRCW